MFSDILTKKLFVILGSEMYHNNDIVGKKMLSLYGTRYQTVSHLPTDGTKSSNM